MTSRGEGVAPSGGVDTTQSSQNASDQTLASSKAKSVFLANLRHELRTPVNAIIGYSEMLMEDALAQGRSEAVPDLQKIRDAGHRLLVLVNDTLDASKLEDKDVDVSSEAFAARVRHALRTPLNAALGYTEMLMETSGFGGPSDLSSDLQKILAAGRRLLGSLDEIVKVAQMQAGRLSVDVSSSSAASMVRGLVSALAPAGAAPPAIGTAEHATVLIVDDNEMNRDILARHLERQGHSAFVASSGLQALEMVRQQAFDLVLLDIMMPDMNGYQVLEQLKSDEALQRIPVIAISALDDVDSVVRCLAMGAADYLPKPVNPLLLRARVSAALVSKRAHDLEQAYLKQAEEQRERSERLLLNVLPKAVTDRLKRGESTIADEFQEATVLFADLVGFTALAARTPPAKVLDRLNSIFSTFDELAEALGLEKIKTIGDAYMAAAGVPVARPDHARAVADMALAMQRVAPQLSRELNEPVQFRIGIHSGPLIAGVIGTKKFAYDLWGDTVNVASRMESNSMPGGILTSETTYELLRATYAFEPRGAIDVRGKGRMATYWLVGRA